MVFNTAVHVVMYYYYFIRSWYGVTPKWKYMITYFQIVQFFSSFVMFGGTSYYVGRGEGCGGYGWLCGQVFFNLILFGGFLGVRKSNGKREGKKEKGI